MHLLLAFLTFECCFSSLSLDESTPATFQVGSEYLSHLEGTGLFSIRDITSPESLKQKASDLLSEISVRENMLFRSCSVESVESAKEVILFFDWMFGECRVLDYACRFVNYHVNDLHWKSACKIIREALTRAMNNVFISTERVSIVFGSGELLQATLETTEATLETTEGHSLIHKMGLSEKEDGLSLELYRASERLVRFLSGFGRRVSEERVGEFWNAFTAAENVKKALLNERQNVLKGSSTSSSLIEEWKQKGAAFFAAQQTMARLSGYGSMSKYAYETSALETFEVSKGRDMDSVEGLELAGEDAVARLLRAAYYRVIVDGLGQAFAIEGVQRERLLSKHEDQPALISLREALTGLIVVSKALLDFDVEIDLEQAPTLWSASSAVLTVSRNGKLFGRVFVEFAESSSVNAAILAAKCRTRTSEPAIVLMHMCKGLRPVSTIQEGSVDLENKFSKGYSIYSILDRYAVTLVYMQALFHEFGHALHCIGGDSVFLQLSGMSFAREDYVELPALFFEHAAREWQLFLKKNNPQKFSSIVVPPAVLPEQFKTTLFGSILAHCMTVGIFADCAGIVLQDSSIDVPAYVYALSMGEAIAMNQYAYAYVVADAVSAMVFITGDFPSKLRAVFDRLKFKVDTGALDWHAGTLVDPSMIEPLQREDGIREFFSCGAANNSFNKFLAIVPGLDTRLERSEFFEDAIDFSALAAILRTAG